MNEVRAVIEAFDDASANRERCAMATIVHVEGSSYRRPGARMLVRESGETAGTISAGCLENDVVEHAKSVMRSGEPKLVVYDNASTTDEIAWGLGLGCNGVIRVFIEPLAANSLYIDALRRSLAASSEAGPILMATVYEFKGGAASGVTIGSRVLIHDETRAEHETVSDDAAAVIEYEVRKHDRAGAMSDVINIDIDGDSAEVFFQRLMPPVPLVIFGAGHDALPIVELAKAIGWQTEVVDPQGRESSLARFDIADEVTLARPDNVAEHVMVTHRTMALLMSHNYAHDLVLLKFLLDSPARYIGVMGPRKRTVRMLEELGKLDELQLLQETSLSRIHSPVGLDIGANGPAEIALSIVAEMRAVLDGRGGGLLRDRQSLSQAQISANNSASSNRNGVAPKSRREPIAVDGRSTERVGAIILAAGSSSRMGRPKQTIKFGGMTLIRRAVLAAMEAGCSPVIVVTGAHADSSRDELEGLDVIEILNPYWETGMASSIGAGLDGLLASDPSASAVVFMLCDQPFVNADVIARLIAASRVTNGPIIASTYGETFGVPALFRRSMFDELAGLEGAAGAKEVIKRHASEAHFRSFPDGDVDVDTPDDLLQLTSHDREAADAIDRIFVADYDERAEPPDSAEDYPA